MKKLFWILLIVIVFIWGLSACSDDDRPEPQTGSTNVFATLKVGDMSRYVRFIGEKYYDSTNHNVSFVIDTLEVSLLEIVGTDTYRIQEQYAEGSETLGKIRSGEIGADSVATYTLKRNGDEWEFTSDQENGFSSIMFEYFQNSFTLPLTRIEENRLEPLGWKVNPQYQDTAGHVIDFPYRGQTFSHVNVIHDANQIIVDGPSYTWIYGKDIGLVRFYQVSSWTQQGYGWEWVE